MCECKTNAGLSLGKRTWTGLGQWSAWVHHERGRVAAPRNAVPCVRVCQEQGLLGGARGCSRRGCSVVSGWRGCTKRVKRAAALRDAVPRVSVCVCVWHMGGQGLVWVPSCVRGLSDILLCPMCNPCHAFVVVQCGYCKRSSSTFQILLGRTLSHSCLCCRRPISLEQSYRPHFFCGPYGALVRVHW